MTCHQDTPKLSSIISMPDATLQLPPLQVYKTNVSRLQHHYNFRVVLLLRQVVNSFTVAADIAFDYALRRWRAFDP